MASPAESSVNHYADTYSANGAAAAEHGEGEVSENFQGPHKWRQHLRHVKQRMPEHDDSNVTEETKENASER